MNNKETTKPATENNSLMRKTKAQLVEIILRKDSIEKNLRADIKDLEYICKEHKNNFDKLDRYKDKLSVDYQNICDEKVSIECELSNIIKKEKHLLLFLIIVLFISIGLNYILFVN